MSEKNYSYTTKFNGNLLTVRGDSIAEFGQNIQSLGADIGALINQMEQSINAGGTLNGTLGATPVDPPMNPQQNNNQSQGNGNPWDVGGQPPRQGNNGPWGQPQQQGGQQWGDNQPQQAPQGNGQWGQPPAQQGGWGGQPQGGGDWRADPTIQPPHLQPPMTPFGPAKYKGGFAKKNNKPYRIWSDPRPWNDIKNLPEDQRFSQFIKDSEL